ncbi:hydrolase [Candidatus Vecturithrix granuli]|uniref:Hydrolase n=1 Tax=Vecturithrix granuli TaxID=1499967 RepID=A0A081BTW4_VECG1|nr:hydrolase [Candidatus Vecturithrix granuli]
MQCQIRDIDVYYEIYGEGRPLLMIHGFGPDHQLMTGCMEPVFQGHPGWQRIYFDLPGMGKTPGKSWITNSDQMLSIVLEFMDQMFPNQRVIIAGESYGGYLARGIIKQRPMQVDGLFLLCPLIEADRTKRVLPAPVVLVKDEQLLTRLTPADREEFEAITVVQTAAIWERFQKEIMSGLQLADEPFLARLQVEGYAFSFAVDALPVPFEKPTLVLLGRQDISVGYRNAWNILENYPRASFVILDRAGHNLQIEQAALFHALVNEWLDRVEEYLA